MKLRHIMPTSLVLAFGLVALQIPAAATNAAGVSPTMSQPAAKAADGFINVYGYNLDLRRTHFTGSAYTWQGLRPLAPKILPQGWARSTLAPEKLCETLHELYDKYAIQADNDANPLITLTDFARTDTGSDPNSETVLSRKLGSPSQSDVDELKNALLKAQRRVTAEKTLANVYHKPDWQKAVERQDVVSDIAKARTSALQSLTAIMIYDAGLEKCPAYAKEKRYAPIY